MPTDFQLNAVIRMLTDKLEATEAERDALRGLLREALAYLKTGQWAVPTDITLLSRINAALNKGGANE